MDNITRRRLLYCLTSLHRNVVESRSKQGWKEMMENKLLKHPRMGYTAQMARSAVFNLVMTCFLFYTFTMNLPLRLEIHSRLPVTRHPPNTRAVPAKILAWS